MTKKISLSLSLFILLTTATVLSQSVMQQQQQQVRIAYVNTTELLNAFPEREIASQRLLELSENYRRELELMQNEYNRKYADFITHQATLAENIKLRRMQELTEMENRIRQFMELAQQDIENQEQVMLLPLKRAINEAIQAVGIEFNFAVIYDLANPAIAFLSPDAVDANPLVKLRLGII
jgi:outer membrane protein